jgi:hypothetical protein
MGLPVLARTLLKKDDTCSKGLDAAAYSNTQNKERKES